MGWLSGALLGVACVAAAPFTGGGSLLAGASLGASLAGAGTMAAAAGAAVTGAAIGDMLEEERDSKNRYEGRQSGFKDGLKKGEILAMQKLRDKMQANSKLRLGVFALAYYVANVDNDFADEERIAIEQAVGRPDASWNGVGIREEFHKIMDSNLSFNEIVIKYLDDIDKETFNEIDEVVMDVINADNKISYGERKFLDNDWAMLKRCYK